MKRKSTEDFINEMKIKQPNIEIQGDYINNKLLSSAIVVYVVMFGNPRPDQLVRGQGCPFVDIRRE